MPAVKCPCHKHGECSGLNTQTCPPGSVEPFDEGMERQVCGGVGDDLRGWL